MPCLNPSPRPVQSSRIGSNLSFSAKHAETFQQMAQEIRQSGLSARAGTLSPVSPCVLAWFLGSSGTEKRIATEMHACELRTSLYRVNLIMKCLLEFFASIPSPRVQPRQ